MKRKTELKKKTPPRKGAVVICGQADCSETFYAAPYRLDGRNLFCSRQCSNKRYLTNTELKCAYCGSSFYCSKSQETARNRKHCSVACMGKANTARAEERNKVSPPSKGVLNRRMRYSKRANDWRVAVFKRDNYACQFCGARNGNGKRVELEADHIKPWAYFEELRFELSNGRTLCKPCHKTTETFGSGAKQYAAQNTA